MAQPSAADVRRETQSPRALEIHVDPDRLMIGADCVGVDATRSDAPRERRRDETEIDPASAIGRALVFSMAGRGPCVDEG